MILLRFLRMEQGLSQWDLAMRAGISNTRLCLLERQRVKPRPEETEALARALQEAPGGLFEDICTGGNGGKKGGNKVKPH